MVAADYLAHWVIRACEAGGLSIPEEVCLLGVDNCREICEFSSVAISSIDNNAFQHGYEGATLLGQLLAGRPAPKEPMLVPPGPLHVRASTDVRATRHPNVALALRVIAEHFNDPFLTPKRLAAKVSMSERRLHDAFVRHVGRSIYQELTHHRLQQALKLIQGTTKKLWDIAQASGFNSPEVMSRVFHRQLGRPPSAFRRESL
jgi:LacI family transcriptional regulator